jgi:hypothetical protein
MYTVVSTADDVGQLDIGTIAWDRNGAPVAKDVSGWFVVGGGRIADLTERLPLAVPVPEPVGRAGDDTPCETCATEEDAAARPEPAWPGALVRRVAELIRIEFPDTHPHSRVNRLRSESAAARIITFLAAQRTALTGRDDSSGADADER